MLRLVEGAVLVVDRDKTVPGESDDELGMGAKIEDVANDTDEPIPPGEVNSFEILGKEDLFWPDRDRHAGSDGG